MRYFELSQEGLKQKIRGGEQVAGYSSLRLGVALTIRFFTCPLVVGFS